MLRLATSVAAVSLLGTTAAHSVIACNQDDVQQSPIGGGIMSVDVMRATGADPYMKAAYDRGQGWLDDALDFRQLPWGYRGPFPLQDMTKFVGSPGRTFFARFYGFYRDFGERRPFRIRKDCTATQTRISYYNAFDDYPNVVVVISWDREYREPPLRAAPPKKRMPPKKRRPPAKTTR